MKKLFLVSSLLAVFAFAQQSKAADVTLTITVRDASVAMTIAAVNSVWPGRIAAGKTHKQWVEIHMRQWLRGIVASYKTRMDREAAEAAAGFAETEPDDILISVSGE